MYKVKGDLFYQKKNDYIMIYGIAKMCLSALVIYPL